MEHVTAKQAADLTGQSERTIRRWIKDGKLRARKIAPNRYEIAVSDLPPRKRSPYADLRARIDALEARIETLERAQNANSPYNALRGDSDGLRTWDVSSITPASHKATVPAYTATSSASSFRTHTDAARWLTSHGVNSEYTPKSWTNWRSTPLTREDVLRFALSRQDTSDWRIQWRLHRCGDPACVCVEMLG